MELFQVIERLKEQWDRDPRPIYIEAANLLSNLRNEVDKLRAQVDQLRSEVEAGDKDEQELYACRDRCAGLEKSFEELLKQFRAEQADNHRLRTKLSELTAEHNRLKDMRQQWLDRDRDNQIVIQTLKDVISDLR